jgi:hypothetical protein
LNGLNDLNLFFLLFLIVPDAMRRLSTTPSFTARDDPGPLMPEEMEKAIREMPRDAEAIELQKLSAAGPVPAP